MRRCWRLLSVAAYTLVAVGIARPALAQGGEPPGRPGPEAAERRFERRIARLVQDRLRLSDDQLRRLTEVNRGRAPLRQELFARERNARVAMRREIMRGD